MGKNIVTKSYQATIMVDCVEGSIQSSPLAAAAAAAAKSHQSCLTL